MFRLGGCPLQRGRRVLELHPSAVENFQVPSRHHNGEGGSIVLLRFLHGARVLDDAPSRRDGVRETDMDTPSGK